MKLEDCYMRIDKYMQSSDRYPRLVNVNNSDDMNSICTQIGRASCRERV